MFARDIMTRNVITIDPATKVEDIARLLIEKRISGVPVLDSGGSLVGIVSEGDLVHRVIGDHEAPRAWWLTLLGDPQASAREYRRAHGRCAADVMTRNVHTVPPDMHIADIARLLEAKGIKRVPVVKDGKLVGLISRANIVQAFAARKAHIPPVKPADSAIRERILDELGAHNWANTNYLDVTVADGGVSCWGFVPNDDARRAVILAATNIAGVASVEDNLRILRIPPEAC